MSNLCRGCKGAKYVQCMSICPRCGGSGTDMIGVPRATVESVEKATFTSGGERFSYESVGNRALDKSLK